MAIQTLLFASLLILSSIESNHGATEVSLFTNLENSLEFTAKPIRVGVVLEAGKDMVRIIWVLKSSAKVNDDAAFKTAEVKLCYAPISQVDRPWRNTHTSSLGTEAALTRFCQSPMKRSLNHSTGPSTVISPLEPTSYVPTACVNGQEVAYGQSSDAEKTTNLFRVEGISGRLTLLHIASICFSVFSFGSLLVFLVKEKRKVKLQQRE